MSIETFRQSRERSTPISVSFEFFPPKTEEMEQTLWASVARLAPLKPNFVSVTYGAGGSTRERTHATIVRILGETNLKPAAHLTCVAATREEIDKVARGYWEAGVRHVVALRGDPPEGAGKHYVPHPGGYPYSVSLTVRQAYTRYFAVDVPSSSTSDAAASRLWEFWVRDEQARQKYAETYRDFKSRAKFP